MKCRTKFLPLTATYFISLLFVGCATHNPNQLSLEEADAARQQLIAKKQLAPGYTPVNYVQPINKKQACKFPFSKEYTSLTNAKIYWDGNCKDGYAYGLGRVIFRSDLEDFDGITLADFRAKKNNFEIDIFYDQNLIRSYSYPNDWAGPVVSQDLTFSAEGELFEVNRYTDDATGEVYTSYSSPFNPIDRISVVKDGVQYNFLDFSKVPQETVDQVSERWVLTDPADTSFTPIGVGLNRVLETGETVFVRYTPNGRQFVSVPNKYFDPFTTALRSAQMYLDTVSSITPQTQKLFKKYKEQVCTSRTSRIPTGLTAKDFYRICNIQEQLNEKFNAAFAKYKADEGSRIKIAHEKLKQSREQQLHREQVATYRAQQDAAYRTARAAESQARAAHIQASAAQQQANAATMQANKIASPVFCNFIGNSMICN